jgi:hypothetical protein
MARMDGCICALLLLASLFAANQAAAAESYDNCNNYITSLPTVISTQGVWCFNKDLNTAITSGDAITVNTNNVTIDCNDFKLGGLAAGVGTTTHGIFANTRLNTTIRHCNIRGFFIGIYFIGNGGGHVIEDNRFDGNTAIGMNITGDGSVIRRNRVFDTGGSTAYSHAIGISTLYNVDVIDNTVSGATARSTGNGNASGIFTDTDSSGRIIGNGVSGLVKDGTGVNRGIYNSTSDRITLRDNDVIGDGSTGSLGLSCSSANGGARDNVISAFATAITTCTDSGGNTVVP